MSGVVHTLCMEACHLVFDKGSGMVCLHSSRFGNATVYEVTKRGWEDLIFQRIRAVFGYGL